jgi:predicted small lipoprotein YifL
LTRRALVGGLALACLPALATCGRKGPLERPKGDDEDEKKKSRRRTQ